MLFEGDNVYIAGLTGMSGAGKTTACEVFEDHGFHIIDCDIVSREVVEKGRPALSEIAAEFGSDVITPDGVLDRKKLGSIVFGSREKLDRLNALIYPYITFEIIRKIRNISESGGNLLLLDAPTLFESGADALCDTVVSVTADIKKCSERIMKRDGLTIEQAEKRLSSQHGAEFYRERSRFCAENTGTREEFVRNLSVIAEEIKSLVLN